MPKQITLIRHAKVMMSHSEKIPASQMPQWVERYNHAAVENRLPDKEVIACITQADKVLASSLSRTHDSLALLDVVPDEVSALFDEAQIPATKKIPYLKLHPKVWLVVLRIMMVLGFGKNSKSFKTSKQRASQAAEYLDKEVGYHDNVVLMGHGGINWLIAKALKKRGYKCIKEEKSSQNWGYQVYEKKS